MRNKTCKIRGCCEPRLGRSTFCRLHHRAYSRALYCQHKLEHEVWFKQERQRQIKKLLQASTSAERIAIKQGRKDSQKLRQEVERL